MAEAVEAGKTREKREGTRGNKREQENYAFDSGNACQKSWTQIILVRFGNDRLWADNYSLRIVRGTQG